MAITCVYIDKSQLFIADSVRTLKLVLETRFKRFAYINKH